MLTDSSNLLVSPTQTLHSFQESALSRFSPSRRMVILPYGSGKSWMSLTHIQAADIPGFITVILCPKRNVLTWEIEISKRRPDARVYSHAAGLSSLLQQAPASFTSETYLLLPHTQVVPQWSSLTSLLARYPIRALLGDESTAFKNPKTKIATAMHDLAGWSVPLRMALTGRLMPEGPHEAWSQLNFVYPGKHNPLGESDYKCKRRWFIKTDFAWALDLSKSQDFYRRIADASVFFTDEEYTAFLTTKQITNQYLTEYYTPSTEQTRLLNHLYAYWELPSAAHSLDDVEEHIEGEGSLAEEYHSTFSVLQKAAQISSGFYYQDGVPIYLKQNPKLTLLTDILKQLLQEKSSRKVVIWSRFAAERGPMQLALASASISTVIGPDTDALRAFASLSKASPRAIIMPASITRGFNELTAADTNIFYSQVYSSELRDQAEKRLDRLGQNSPVINQIDISSSLPIDLELLSAIQAKNASPSRLNAIVNKYRERILS